MRVVLDAGAAVELGFCRPRAADLAPFVEAADEVLAPDLLVAEVTNTVWTYHQLAGLALDLCEEGLERALGLVDRLAPCLELYREAYLLARSARRTVYDMMYLSLARREDALLVTTDRALAREAARQGVRVG